MYVGVIFADTSTSSIAAMHGHTGQFPITLPVVYHVTFECAKLQRRVAG